MRTTYIISANNETGFYYGKEFSTAEEAIDEVNRISVDTIDEITKDDTAYITVELVTIDDNGEIDTLIDIWTLKADFGVRYEDRENGIHTIRTAKVYYKDSMEYYEKEYGGNWESVEYGYAADY